MIAVNLASDNIDIGSFTLPLCKPMTCTEKQEQWAQDVKGDVDSM